MKRLTEEQKNEIYKLYTEGLCQEKVGEILGLERTVVGYWVRKFGIQRNLSEAHKGQHSSPETQFKKGLIPWNKGRDHPNVKREKNPAWKGGVAGEHKAIRCSDKYKSWRRDVFIRDHFTCQTCGHRFIKIVAHHIKEFSDYPDLRFDVNNGQTLCRACHCKVHNPAKKEKLCVS